jgi:hypothetical protein
LFINILPLQAACKKPIERESPAGTFPICKGNILTQQQIRLKSWVNKPDFHKISGLDFQSFLKYLLK